MTERKHIFFYPHTQTTYYSLICNLSNKILFDILFVLYLYPEFYNFKLNKISFI
jgi:hypothetical protein